MWSLGALPTSVAFGLAMLAPGGAARAAGTARPPVLQFLRNAGFTAEQISQLRDGKVVTRRAAPSMVAPNDTAEVAVIGAVRVDVPREAFVAAVKDIAGFRYAGIHRVTVIGDPPRLSDFAALSLPTEDVEALQDCRPGRCDVKLGGPTLAELRTRIDWRAPNHAEQVQRLARERLKGATTRYLREGTAAFSPLVDKEAAISIEEQLRQLLANTPGLLTYYPELHDYALEFPRLKLAHSLDVFYWALVDFGLKPTVIITHAVAYAPSGSDDVVVLWKQLYASHYFNGGLAVTTYSHDPGGSYVVHQDRVRVDGLGGLFGRIKRKKFADSSQKALRRFLEAARTNLRARVTPGTHP